MLEHEEMIGSEVDAVADGSGALVLDVTVDVTEDGVSDVMGSRTGGPGLGGGEGCDVI